MRTSVRLALAALLIGMGSQEAWAGCPAGYVLKKIGNTQTDDANVSTQGHDVAAVLQVCTGTACVGGFYNADGLEGATTANLTFEAGAPASQLAGAHGIIDLTDSPVYFSAGITFVDDGNVSAVTLYSCQPR